MAVYELPQAPAYLERQTLVEGSRYWPGLQAVIGRGGKGGIIIRAGAALQLTAAGRPGQLTLAEALECLGKGGVLAHVVPAASQGLKIE